MSAAVVNQRENTNSQAKYEEQTSAALLDARIKAIEEQLKILRGNSGKVKFEVEQEGPKLIDPNQVVEISDDEIDDTFNPPTTSTRIKDESEQNEYRDA